ncbi:MAG: hypothetical protein M3335_01485 [Actinomycetota bacterium]|nr:hypothetical protein [Actinomycetota bacterium]
MPQVVRSDCEAAAEEMDAGAVYCPPLVPAGRTYSQNRSSQGEVSVDARGDEYVLSFVTSTLKGRDEAQSKNFRRHPGHWLIRAADEPAELTQGPGVKVVKEVVVANTLVTIVQRKWVAYDIDAGHVFAVWRFGGRTFEISLHGFENRNLLLPIVEASIKQMRNCPETPSDEPVPGCELVIPAA